MTARRVRPADVSRWAREIVAKRALILLAVAAVGHIGVTAGWLPGDISESAETTVAGIIDGIAAVGAIFWIRTGTTPADPALAPTSSNGVPLVEAATGHDPDGHVRRIERAEVEERIGHLPPPGEHRRP